MKFSFAKALRRATRTTRTAKARSATKSMQRAISSAMLKSVAASLSNLSAMAPSKPKPARKRRKAAVGASRKLAAPANAPKDRRLSTVLKQLRAVQATIPAAFLQARPASPSKPPAIPKGAQYLERTHRCSAGAREFMLYLPARQPDGPKGLIVMLHGCTQDPNDFATGTNMNAIAQKHGLAVAYPSQTRKHNPSTCWNWFAPVNQSRGAGEPAIIASLARKLMREFGLGRDVVFVAGLSAGGAMAAILAETYPDVFSAAGVHSGLRRGAANDVRSALSAMRSGAKPAAVSQSQGKATIRADRNVRRIIFHGDADRTVHPSNAAQTVAGLVGTREPARITARSASGRDYVRSDYLLPDGSVDVELWQVKETAHAWSGGKSRGSYADPKGPNASAEMVRFFLSRTS